jgi:hypothetical protein
VAKNESKGRPADKPLAQTNGGTALAVTDQQMMEQFGGMGSENVVIPRLVVVQKTSPEVETGEAKPSELFIKGLGMNLGAGPVEIIPIRRDTSRIRWKDPKVGGGIVCRSKDGRTGVGEPGGNCAVCLMTRWDGAERPSCDQYENVLVVLRNDQEVMPFLISGNRTNLKALKQLNTLLLQEFLKGRPIYSKSYLVGVIRKENAQQAVYWNFTFRPGNENKPLPPEDQKRAHEIFVRFKDVRLEESSAPADEGEPPAAEPRPGI